MVVYLIRHTSVDVPQGVCYGQTDVPLNPTFEEEAAQTSARLKGLQFDKVYMSPLTRCVRLATFCGYPDGERDDRIKEINFGDWEMQRFDEITDANLQKWYADYRNVRATNGESFQDQYQRVADFLNELRQKAIQTGSHIRPWRRIDQCPNLCRNSETRRGFRRTDSIRRYH